ncbi:hypothetical protein EI168_02645 [Halomonas sp. FME1]|uniref:DUF1902 domain-containing protein n=1 Tax=Halomonas casei TaxID=2742613 RepID=A0ABR9EZM7_9GAMM|nr:MULTISPECIES: hypothetical protein [Halomonas]MBE0399007.1 hypothetical protein [Halomonas casei]PCC23007.1 hypothetical protein CIK78_13600 [Halomonas sp. JB37]
MSQHGPVFKVRCFIHREEELFVAHCIDLSLAAQADSMKEAREKLDVMIKDHLQYVVELVREGDMLTAKQMLQRKSPLSVRLTYARFYLMHKVRSGVKNMGNTWRESFQSPLATQ